MTQKTAIYIRVSVLKEEAVSPQMQLDKARQYCKLHDERFEVFQDLDFSGKDTNRPAFQQMLSRIRMGLISKLVVYRLDRVSRSVKDLALFMDMLKERNVEFYSITEQFDTSTPMGRAMINIMAVFAQMEREVISQRILDTKAKQMADGIKLGIAPYGYRHKEGGNNCQWDKVPQEARVVKKIFQLYATDHWSCKSLALYLNRNFPRKAREKIRGQSVWGKGKYTDRWQNWTVNNIISNPTYAGTMSKDMDTQAINLKPIISRKLFRQCEEIRNRRSPRHMLYCHASASDQPLKGRIFCSCGRVMGIRRDHDRTYHFCPNFHKARHIHLARVSMIHRDILDYLKTCKLDRKIIQEAKLKLEGDKDRTEAERMRMITHLQSSYVRLQEQYIDGAINKVLLNHKTVEIKTKLRDLQPKLGSSNRTQMLADMPVIIHKLHNPGLSGARKFREEMIRLFVEKVVWEKDHIASLKIYDEFAGFFPNSYVPQKGVSSYELVRVCPEPKPSPYRIRRLNQKGLLPDNGRYFGSAKRYNMERSIKRLIKINELTKQGYSLDEIGKLIKGEPILVRNVVIAREMGISGQSSRHWLTKLVEPYGKGKNKVMLYNLEEVMRAFREHNVVGKLRHRRHEKCLNNLAVLSQK